MYYNNNNNSTNQEVKVTVIVPAYKVSKKIKEVLKAIPSFVDNIIVVDDRCPQKSGEIAVREEYAIDYVRQLKHRILKKRKSLTDDLLLINGVLDKLQSL